MRANKGSPAEGDSGAEVPGELSQEARRSLEGLGKVCR